ncbi:hypothetical protein ACH5RR_024860 [Cinchona calisaya]|uniref:Uncharacterized protein n=1 Tax=Cinchona calisaya TaxID=153742 RepID=A0ABD2YXZ4_9GENT
MISSCKPIICSMDMTNEKDDFQFYSIICGTNRSYKTFSVATQYWLAAFVLCRSNDVADIDPIINLYACVFVITGGVIKIGLCVMYFFRHFIEPSKACLSLDLLAENEELKKLAATAQIDLRKSEHECREAEVSESVQPSKSSPPFPWDNEHSYTRDMLEALKLSDDLISFMKSTVFAFLFLLIKRLFL